MNNDKQQSHELNEWYIIIAIAFFCCLNILDNPVVQENSNDEELIVDISSPAQLAIITSLSKF